MNRNGETSHYKMLKGDMTEENNQPIRKFELAEVVRNAVEESQRDYLNKIESRKEAIFTEKIVLKLQTYDNEILNINHNFQGLDSISEGLKTTASLAYDMSDANLKSTKELQVMIATLENSLAVF